MAVQCGLKNGANERIKTYYEKKRKEGKPYKVVVIACANKLLHHIHAILVKGEPYQAQIPYLSRNIRAHGGFFGLPKNSIPISLSQSNHLGLTKH